MHPHFSVISDKNYDTKELFDPRSKKTFGIKEDWLQYTKYPFTYKQFCQKEYNPTSCTISDLWSTNSCLKQDISFGHSQAQAWKVFPIVVLPGRQKGKRKKKRKISSVQARLVIAASKLHLVPFQSAATKQSLPTFFFFLCRMQIKI